jgi:hypothetical protein
MNEEQLKSLEDQFRDIVDHHSKKELLQLELSLNRAKRFLEKIDNG